MREVAHAIMNMKLSKALVYLGDVLDHKQAVPFTVFTGGCGRHAQGKMRKAQGGQCRWPQKATKIMLDLLKNAEANAEMKGLDTDNLYVTHAQANRAQKQRRRTYRAHGRIGPYMSNPAHIEIMVAEKDAAVQKGEADESTARPVKLSRKRTAQLRSVNAE
jgi:large subunit ribosomal protein L17e